MPRPVLYGPTGQELQRSTATTLSAAQLDAIIRREQGLSGAVTEPARTVSWYYACLLQIAQCFATLPAKLWFPDPTRRGRKPGYAEVSRRSRLWRFLDRPHPQMSGMSWREKWASILLDQGDVFCLIDREVAPDGLARALTLVGRDKMRPIRSWQPDGPLIAWAYTPRFGAEAERKELDEVIHWSLPNPYDNVMGLAPKDALRMCLDADFARSLYDKSFYQNGANPSAILKYRQGELDEQQREEVRRTWEEYHAGPGRAGRVAVLGGDWDFSVWSFQHSQAQHIESRKLSREEIAACFMSFPVEFLNAQENGGLSRAGEEVARLKLYENCVFPMARRFESEFNSLIQTVDPRTVMAFDVRAIPVALVYADAESQIYERYIKNGISPNDVIESLDLPFDPIKGGDVSLIPNNLVPLDMAGETPAPAIDVTPPPPAPKPPKQVEGPKQQGQGDALTRRLREKAKRILYGIRQAAVADPAKAARGADDGQWREWARLVLPIVAAGVQIGADPTLTDVTDDSLDQLQAAIEDIGCGSVELDMICQREAERVLRLFDETLREAGCAESPRDYCRQLDQAARVIAERAVQAAITAGREVVNMEVAA